MIPVASALIAGGLSVPEPIRPGPDIEQRKNTS